VTSQGEARNDVTFAPPQRAQSKKLGNISAPVDPVDQVEGDEGESYTVD
jgi:hypothetical protein